MSLQSAIPLILPVTCHTSFVGKGSIFVAIKGTKFNGIDFILEALQKGAKQIVVQENLSKEILNLIKKYDANLLHVVDARQALTEISASTWGYPSEKLNIIGITGTKGKTTTTYLLNHLLSYCGFKTAMISGVENVINGKKYLANLTTPLPDYLHAFFFRCIQENVQYVVMESSAQAFSLKRLFNLKFSGAIFTNLDLEHMEFYSTMNEYFSAKCQIFQQLKNNAPVLINIDNDWGKKIANSNQNFSTISFVQKNRANFHVDILKNDKYELHLKVQYKNKKLDFVIPSLIGDFNAYNISCAISMCLELGLDQKKIFEGLQNFKPVAGRMEKYKLSNNTLAVIDYAHNPSSFSYVLPTLKKLANKLIVVFGAGGERDKNKRPMMGNIATCIADHVIITSDNPRSENVKDIMDQILSGVSSSNLNKVICEADRFKAIQIAYNIAKTDDVIAILGKGPDEYQIIGNEKFYFSDKENILSIDQKIKALNNYQKDTADSRV